MIRAFTRHARMAHRPAIGTREHFDWSANGDGLRELEPVTERTAYDGLEVTSIVGTGTSYLPAMALGLCFVLTCIGVSV